MNILNSSSDPVAKKKTFTSGRSVLGGTGLRVDPRVAQLQEEGLGLAKTGLADIRADRAATIGDRSTFMQRRTQPLRERIETQGQALGQRLEKTGVTGEFGEQTRETFSNIANKKIRAGEQLAFDELNALEGNFDQIEGGALQLIERIDINDFAQVMQAKGMSQELTNKLVQIAQGRAGAEQQEQATNMAMAGNLIMAAAMFSDRRLKRNIKKIGEFENGLNIYSYDYVWGEPSVGVMADEVEKVFPDAVIIHNSGYKMVDYGKVIHGSI